MKSSEAIYTGFEFEVEGYPAMAVINKDLKDYADRFTYNYSVLIEIFLDSYDEIGQPTETEYDYLNDVEKKIIEYLENETRTLHIGHTTVYRKREIIFYTKDYDMVNSFLDYFLSTIERENSYEITEDREWQNVEDFYNLI